MTYQNGERKNQGLYLTGISYLSGIPFHMDRDFRYFAPQSQTMDHLLLEETWHCIEDTGISLTILQTKKTAVYEGVIANDYQIDAVARGIVTDSYLCTK